MSTQPAKIELREMRIEDAADLAAAMNNKRVQDNLRDGIPFPYSEKDAVDFMSTAQAAEKNTQYVLAITYGEKVIGNIGVFRKENVHRLTAELGYFIAEPYWGKGIMVEAVRQMCAYIFKNTDIVRIFAGVYTYNEASGRVLEKANFHLEGVLRKNVFKNGQIIDMKLYSILRDEWWDNNGQ